MHHHQSNLKAIRKISFVDPGCLSRIRIFFRPNLTKQKEGTKKYMRCRTFFRGFSFSQSKNCKLFNFVYMQCCGSGMFIPDPDFYPSRIPKQQQKRGVKKNCCNSFLFITNFTKLNIILVCKAEEKNLGQFSKNCITFYPKNCH